MAYRDDSHMFLSALAHKTMVSAKVDIAMFCGVNPLMGSVAVMEIIKINVFFIFPGKS